MRLVANAGVVVGEETEAEAPVRPEQGAVFHQRKNVSEASRQLPRTLKTTGKFWTNGPELIELEIISGGVACSPGANVALSWAQLNKHYVRPAKPALTPV